MIEKVRIRNFKAIREAEIRLDDINAFVGNNGSGKSSVIEALQTLQSILEFGLTEGINKRWVGLEHIRNFNAPEGDSDIFVQVSGKFNSNKYQYFLSFNKLESNGLYIFKSEKLEVNGDLLLEITGVNDQGLGNSFQTIEKNKNRFPKEDEFEIVSLNSKGVLMSHSVLEGIRIEQSGLEFNVDTSILSALPRKEQSLTAQFKSYVLSWYFINIQPESLYFPVPKDFSTFFKGVNSDGKNLADYLLSLDRSDIKERKQIILEKLQYILPYVSQLGANDIQIQNLVYLFLTEQGSTRQIPSWLLSTGTLRALVLLTLFNTVNWPCVFFIEEMENTLDPRTLNLLVDEMDRMTPGHQFIITTHSPYLLDLLEMQHIIVAERMEGGPVYSRPDERQDLDGWKEKFSPGRLYTMNKLTQQ